MMETSPRVIGCAAPADIPGEPKGPLEQILRELFGVDWRSLAAFRVTLGLILGVDLVRRLGDLEVFYTDAGVLPREAVLRYFFFNPYVSIHFLAGSSAGVAALFLVNILIVALLIVGYRTRWMQVLAWFFLISLQNRSGHVLQGGDVFLRCMAFWGMFLPLGAAYSVDARRCRERPRLPNALLSAATVAALLQVVFVYLFTAVLKNGPPWRDTYTAVGMALSIDEFQRLPGRWLLHLLTTHPWLQTAMSFAVIWFEFVGPILLFSPFATGPVRMLTVVLFWCLHIGFGSCLELGLFPFISSMAMVPYIPAWFWDRCLPRALYRRLSAMAAGGLRAADAALRALGRGFAPAVIRWRAPRWREIVVFVFLGWVFWYNLMMIDVIRPAGAVVVENPDATAAAASTASPTDEKQPLVDMPVCVEWIGLWPRLDQKWNMFAPFPMTHDGWYVIHGKTKSGREVNVWRYYCTGDDSLTWDKPEWVVSTYPNQRWRKYMMNLYEADSPRRWYYFSRWLTMRWDRDHPEDPLDYLQVCFMLEKTKMDLSVAPVEKLEKYYYAGEAE